MLLHLSYSPQARGKTWAFWRVSQMAIDGRRTCHNTISREAVLSAVVNLPILGG